MSESIFVRTNHLFLRNPRGGVEDVATMAAAGFGAIFCNIGDYTPSEWETVRVRALAQNVVCGPWLRTGQETFDPELLGFLIDTADEWGSPLIVNSEAEIDYTGDEVTTFIAEEVGDRDAGISVQAWPFASVDWSPLARYPILPQIFPQESEVAKDPEGCRQGWYAAGVQCVVDTFGTYGGAQPDWYDRLSPYGLYTADDCGNVFAPWSAVGTRDPYAPDTQPPTNGGDMAEKIGNQHGISAMADIFRKQWPDKTGKPDPEDPSTWKAIDKWERSQLILVEDHDEGA